MNTGGRWGKRLAVLMLASLMAAGCASRRLHDAGLELVSEGRYEEGLAKLAAATEAAPDNVQYRSDLARQRELAVNRLLAAAERARRDGRLAEAHSLYERVRTVEPANGRADAGLDAVARDRRHEAAIELAQAALRKRDLVVAEETLKPVLIEHPQNERATELQRQIDERKLRDPLTESALKAQFTKPVSLQFRDANLKMVFEALSRTSGINVLLDRDVKPDIKTSIFAKDVSVEDVIDLILLQNQLEKKVISDNTVFIYPATPAKLKDYQDLKIRSFHLTHADPKQILTMIKTLLKTKDVFIHEKTNSIVMRDTPHAIRLAERMVADQDIAEPEVMLEVEVLEVSTTRLSELGIRWPSSVTLSTPEAATTLRQLRDLTGDDLEVSPLSATLNLRLEDSDTNVLASPRIRVRNREKARVMIGSRVPVITNAVTPVSTGSPVVTGSVQYLDVGLKLEVEPDIHLDNEVVIKVGLDVSSIIKEVPNAQSGTLAYQIGTRNANTVLRLKDGETQILAGLISDEDRKTASKVPGLGQMPVLGRLFSSHKDDGTKTEIVLSITPRVVGSGSLPDVRDVEYWTGSESTMRDSLLKTRSLGAVTLETSGATGSGPRARPGALPRPNVSAAADGPLKLFWQGPAQVKVGDTVILTLNAQSNRPFNSLGLEASFDPAVFRPLDAVAGSLLQQNGAAARFEKSINAAGGQVLVDASPGVEAGVSGTGSVVTLSFEAIAASPQSAISIARATPGASGNGPIEAALPAPHGIVVLP